MKRIILLTAATLVAVALATPAHADGGLAATAVCNDQWVVVTVDAPANAVIVGRRPNRRLPVVYGSLFVPDVGGGNPAGDYNIDIRLELWDSTAPDHKVLATGTVHTPTCEPMPEPVARVVVDAAPEVVAPIARTAAVPADTYDVWRHIVEAMHAYV